MNVEVAFVIGGAFLVAVFCGVMIASVDGLKLEKCVECHGTGLVEAKVYYTDLPTVIAETYEPCRACDRKGYIWRKS